MNKFTIITINYNNKVGLQKTIKSVFDQSFGDYEYIIIDGGSTDGSEEVIEQCAARLSYWVSESDKGIYHAMNKGIAQAHGEYLVFMNSGDCFHDSSVLEWVAAQKLDVDIAIGTVECVGTGRLKVPPCNDLSMMDLFRNHPPHQAAFIRRALFEKGGFDESLVLVADWSFFVDRLIFQHTSYRRLDKIISDYDMSGLSTMQTDLLREERYRVLKAFFPERVLKDYEKYKYADSPLLELIPELNRTAGFHRMVYRLVKFLLRCYHWIG